MSAFDASKEDCCFFGRGELFLSDTTDGNSYGHNWGLGWGQAPSSQAPGRPVGNVSNLDISINYEQREVLVLNGINFDRDCSLGTVQSVNFTMTMTCLSDVNMKQALFGTSTSVTASPDPVLEQLVLPTDEVSLSCGVFIPYENPGVDISTLVVTRTDTSEVLVQGTDYEADDCGIKLITSYLFSSGVGLSLAYSYNKDYRCIEALTQNPKNVRLQFKGKNAANNGSSYLVTMYNVRLDPSSTLSLISDDEFSTLTITGTLERDRVTKDEGISKYFSIKRLGA